MKTYEEITTKELKKRLIKEFGGTFSVRKDTGSRYIHLIITEA